MTASGSISAGSSICNLALGRGSILVLPSVLLSYMGAVSSVVAEETKVFSILMGELERRLDSSRYGHVDM